MNKFQLVSVIVNSTGTETRNMTPYDDYDTAFRKFHEAFKTAGAGSKKISVVLMDDNLNSVMHEVWVQTEKPTTTEQTTEQTE